MRRIRTFIAVFALWTLLGSLGKIAFMAMYQSQMDAPSIGDWFAVIYHGLLLDVAIAGYLTLLPGLLLAVQPWWKGKSWAVCWDIYFFITALVSALAYVSNLGLYGYWGFPLDNTSLLYFLSSPADAFASLTTLQLCLAPTAVIILTVGIFYVFRILRKPLMPEKKQRSWGYHRYIPPKRGSLATEILCSVLLILLTATLIIPIRGGFSTGTNHTGSVYFSQDMRLNHAAVNPLFSFVESQVQYKEIGTKYRFMSDAEASRLFSTMVCTTMRSDSIPTTDGEPSIYAKNYQRRNKPNVVVVILESFSKYIMEEGGHVKGVTPCLDKLSGEGMYFTNFYSNSTRTDKALLAVLSGLPAQPTMNVINMPRKSTALPSIARSMASAGYATSFYYGGDANFSNMRSYIVGTGFQQVIAEENFPKQQRTGKWGVPDGPLYNKVLEDLGKRNDSNPHLTTILTGSSHEPFDVPYKGKQPSPQLNAFEYADRCLGDFVKGLRQLPQWKNTMVVIVPDHLGAYPEVLDGYQLWRYEIPLLILGGGIVPQRIATTGSQMDIAATILAMAGLQHSDFLFSKDLLDLSAPHFALFAFPDAIGIVGDNGSFAIHDNAANNIVNSDGKNVSSLCKKAKAHLQKLYDFLDKL